MALSSSPAAGVSSTVKRASSRARRRPDVYTTSPFTSSKRKRDEQEVQHADGDVDMDGEEESEEDDDSEDDEPAEEEVRERAKRARKPKSSAPKKPAQKRSKPNGVTLPIRAATKAPAKKRAPKKAKIADGADAEAAGGLYAEVFAHDKTIEQVVADWLEAFTEHESLALSDVVNFVLKAAGCNGKVTEHDTEDPDNASNRITDLQEEYQATQPTEYPMISKGKGLNAKAFKKTVAEFFDILIQTIAAKGWLKSNNSELIENIQVWLSSLTSATNRAFRHTSTVCALSVIGALCEVTKGLGQKATDDQSLAESERKKKNANKGRIKEFEQKAKEGNEQLETGRDLLRDWFDTIFIHRYRDIDANIRRDCVEALGDWIAILPDQFFDGNHLRYLGWLLSDENASVRAEVLEQLHRFYSDSNKLGGLKTFTERFRPRLVEIGTSDADINVRISGLKLLDLLREDDLLEPDDHDLVGRLVFHDDPKVRKAVAGFFAASVKDLYESKIEALGGEEALEESLPDDGTFEAPQLDWLRYKSLAEMLQAYDDDDDDLPAQIERSKLDGSLILRAQGCDSRFTFAVDALYDKIKEIQEWQAVAGYLLFDHSRGRANGVGDDPLSQLKHESTLQEAEEIILLEVLNATVKHSMTELAERITSHKSKLTKKQKEDLEEEQGEAVRHLTDLIPKLLKKFGDVPHTAAAVLRLGNVLALPSLEGLRHDSAASSALLDDLRKQFMAHGGDEVLAPATGAISHAISYGELDDAAMEKVSSLWEDVVNNLAELLDVKTITVRGCSQQEELLALANNLLRIIRLATVTNPIDPLEESNVAAKDDSTGKEYNGAIDFIVDLTKRAQHSSGPAPDPEEAALEDVVAARAAEAALFYFQWKITALVNAVKAGQDIDYEVLAALAERRDAFVDNLAAIMDGRRAGDEVSRKAARTLLDIYITSAVLRMQEPRPGMSDEYTVLIMDLDADYEKAIMKVFAAAEREYAKLSNRKLEAPVSESKDDDEDVDADPVDDDPLSDDEDEDEETQQTQTQPFTQRDAKLSKPLLAEERLCQLTTKLVWAVLAGVIDDKATRKRLERNKNRLGPNFKEVLAFLDVQEVAKKGKSVKKAASAAKKLNGTAVKARKGKASAKSNAIVAEDEEEDEIEDEDMEEGDAQVMRRRELDVEEAADEEQELVGNGAADEEDGDAESVLGD